MKIAILNKYQGKVFRGAETFVSELSRRLSEKFDINVISDINYWKLFLGRYDVIIPTNGREQVFLVRIICLLIGAKMIVSGQSGSGADDKWNLLMFPDVFVALTNYQKEWAKKFNPFVKVKTIPNGVDLDKFNPKVKPIKINLEKPIVLSVGALSGEKRLDLIIRAVAKTKSSLFLVGKGKLEKDLQRLGDELLPGRFKIMDFSHDEMPGVYTACDIFVYMPLAWESFGIVMLEALASNLPIVVNDDAIRREIVGNSGLFVSDNLSKKIQESEKIKWGNKPRERAEEFSWDEVAKKYIELIEELKS